jgi:hypothetical protein
MEKLQDCCHPGVIPASLRRRGVLALDPVRRAARTKDESRRFDTMPSSPSLQARMSPRRPWGSGGGQWGRGHRYRRALGFAGLGALSGGERVMALSGISRPESAWGSAAGQGIRQLPQATDITAQMLTAGLCRYCCKSRQGTDWEAKQARRAAESLALFEGQNSALRDKQWPSRSCHPRRAQPSPLRHRRCR